MSWSPGSEIVNSILHAINTTDIDAGVDLGMFWSEIYTTLDSMGFQDWHNHYGVDHDLDRIIALREMEKVIDYDPENFDEALNVFRSSLSPDDIGLLEAIRKIK